MMIIEHVPPTALNRWRHNRRIRRMGEDVIPRDKSWQVYLTFAALMAAFAVMFVRWWLAI